jgi:enoyl-CoA hydratase/carnithine racemase
MPFSTTCIDGVLTLTLDTPGASVNIFNRATAKQTLDILAGVRAGDTRAVVLRSAKRQSFMNGVGMMLANAANSYDDVVRSSQELRDAFVAFRDCPVPTIAIVQGTCWGCGVELLLNMHHRIAADTFETHFYMTELKEYLFIPLFRSTRNLPEAVGLSDAIDLLLWGERWGARQAARRGLINEWASPERFDAAAESFVARVLRGEVASCRRAPSASRRARHDDADASARARARIASLPSAYRRVYLDALELLEDAARRDVGDEHRLRELEKCADSTLCELGKSAYAFFYIKETAATLAQGRGRDEASLRALAFERAPLAEETGAYAAFYRTLAARKPPEVSVDIEETPVPGIDPSHVVIAYASSKRKETPNEMVAAGVCAFAERVPARRLVIYRPVDSPHADFVELVERDAGAGAPLARLLARCGYQVSIATMGREFASNRLLRAFFAPLVAAVLDRVPVETIEGTLRDFGFVARPADLQRGLPCREFAACVQPAVVGAPSLDDVHGALDRLSRPAAVLDSRPCTDLLDGLMTSLAAAVWQDRCGSPEEGGFRHPAVVDLAARELLDFPLRARSLCRHLSRDRVRMAEAAASRFASGEVRARAAAYAGSARDFYRG